MHTIEKQTLERWMQIAQDVKKEFSYDKYYGSWYWHDRGDETLYGPQDTFLDALEDAIHPYLEDDGD